MICCTITSILWDLEPWLVMKRPSGHGSVLLTFSELVLTPAASTDLPTHGPSITGGRERYRIGDLIQLNCTSPGTVPPPKLTWYIDGEKVSALLVHRRRRNRECTYPNCLVNSVTVSVLSPTWYIKVAERGCSQTHLVCTSSLVHEDTGIAWYINDR